jgi:glycosyltransferase involved in cell wall biosynthesis
MRTPVSSSGSSLYSPILSETAEAGGRQSLMIRIVPNRGPEKWYLLIYALVNYMSFKKIKPLIIHPMDPLGSKIGGIETFIKNFVKYAPDDFEVYFVGVSSDKKERPVGRWRKIEVYNKEVSFLPILYVKEENLKAKIPLSLKFTLSLLRHRRQLILEDKVLEFHRIEPSLPFADASERRLLFVHGNTADLYNPHTEVKWRSFPWLYFQVEKRFIGQMERVFVVRKDGVEFYKKRYPSMADRFLFLPTWVDDETFFAFNGKDKERHSRSFLQKRSLPVNSRLVLFVGRLEGPKDPLLLVDAFRYVNEHIPEARLLIVGNGVLRGKMESRIKHYGLEGKVNFLGALPQAEVADLMRISDVFLLTSAFEGMPMSVVEALGCGLPVVSTDVGEVKRVVKGGVSGVLCPERDASIIGNAVLEVLEGRSLTVENCLLSVREYTARRILSNLYKMHYSPGA